MLHRLRFSDWWAGRSVGVKDRTMDPKEKKGEETKISPSQTFCKVPYAVHTTRESVKPSPGYYQEQMTMPLVSTDKIILQQQPEKVKNVGESCVRGGKAQERDCGKQGICKLKGSGGCQDRRVP